MSTHSHLSTESISYMGAIKSSINDTKTKSSPKIKRPSRTLSTTSKQTTPDFSTPTTDNATLINIQKQITKFLEIINFMMSKIKTLHTKLTPKPNTNSKPQPTTTNSNNNKTMSYVTQVSSSP